MRYDDEAEVTLGDLTVVAAGVGCCRRRSTIVTAGGGGGGSGVGRVVAAVAAGGDHEREHQENRQPTESSHLFPSSEAAVPAAGAFEFDFAP